MGREAQATAFEGRGQANKKVHAQAVSKLPKAVDKGKMNLMELHDDGNDASLLEEELDRLQEMRQSHESVVHEKEFSVSLPVETEAERRAKIEREVEAKYKALLTSMRKGYEKAIQQLRRQLLT